LAIAVAPCRPLLRLQRQIEALYQLEPGPDVCSFVEFDPEVDHETVLVAEDASEAVELLVVFPEGLDVHAPMLSDGHLQLIEGVSHFVHLAERARTELPTTELELELQAEVDKFADLAPQHDASSHPELHQWLFERVTFLHPADTTRGQRYRLANELAARLWARLVHRGDESFTRQLLYRFYRLGQAEKLSLIAAV
jgi:hypothetical protein